MRDGAERGAARRPLCGHGDRRLAEVPLSVPRAILRPPWALLGFPRRHTSTGCVFQAPRACVLPFGLVSSL